MKTIREILTQLKEKASYVIDREKNIALTREQIGETISADYEEAVICLEENLFMDAFVAADKEMAEVLQTLEGKFALSEQILYHLQYALNPNMPFSYKDIIYRDVSTMGNAILDGKAEKATIVEAMKNKLISLYAKLKTLDEVRTDIIEHIDFAENYLEKNADIAYYLLGYYLSDRKYYKYEGHKFLSVVTLYTYLTNKKKLIKFSNTMEKDLLFITWLYCLGNGQTYEKWANEVHRIEIMDYEKFHDASVQPTLYPVEKKESKRKKKEKKAK